MKKFLFMILALVAMASCTTSSKEVGTTNIQVEDSIVVDSFNIEIPVDTAVR